MGRSGLSRLLVNAAIACAFIAAEALAFGHTLDLDAHSGEEPCKVCICVAGLGSAAVGKTDAHLPRNIAPLIPEPGLAITRPFDCNVPPARGPPR